MPRALKVYRTPIGFHDAYVAAPSQKAAIDAWGSAKDLFSRGEAEIVTDPALTAEPLAKPGVVVKRLRGSAAEQIEALGPSPATPPRRKEKGGAPPSPPRPKLKSKAKPRPSRAAVEAAEEALRTAEQRQRGELKDLAEREAALARERKALERAQSDEIARLTRTKDKAEVAYREAVLRWRG